METLALKKEKVAEKEKTISISGSEAVLKAFLAEGVETVFGYPGGAIMPIYDALYDYQEQLNHILVRHEQGAIHAAQGYARASGRPGIVLRPAGRELPTW
jgi:acetolactate synthase-1/2/3 large subunit